jgi:hypothetical protein
LISHGTVVRKLTEKEYDGQQAYVVPDFSGHWMFFSSAALMLLVAVARIGGCPPGSTTPTSSSPVGQGPGPVATADGAQQVESKAEAKPPPEPKEDSALPTSASCHHRWNTGATFISAGLVWCNRIRHYKGSEIDCVSACSPETGAYCTARKRLPEKFFADVTCQTG